MKSFEKKFRVPAPTPGILFLLSLIAVGTSWAEAEQDDEWPQEITAQNGRVVMYQPQVDRLDGDRLYARAATSVTLTGNEEPVFGAVWLEARVRTDADARTVDLVDLKVPRVRFPEAPPERERNLADLLTREIPNWNLDLSRDRLLATLDIAEKRNVASQDFNVEPPRIVVVDYPAVLVTFDGRPELRSVKNSDLQVVINTSFFIVADPKEKASFLYGGSKAWYRAEHPEGPWAVADSVPQYIQAVAPRDEEMVLEQTGTKAPTAPAIVTANEPTELLVTDGPPEYAPLADGQLLYVSNSESDLLKEVATQRFFALLSGRWFASPSLDGSWEFVAANELPESFSEISETSERGHLLTWVAGTEMAKDAVLDAHIPQTAGIRRDATIEVSYDGEPRFENIEGTDLAYAVNTPYDVIRAGSSYYCAHEAVWYKADQAGGPWRVADEVPEEFLTLPAECPLYHCKYLHIYDSTPEVVYVGYYPGYLHSFVVDDCLVYGTGWQYRPWRGRYWYYPRPRTWGMHARWNPWHGWGFGFSYSTGRYTFALGTGSGYRRAWWGDGGYRGYRKGHYHGWNQGYRQGRRDGYRTPTNDASRNLYQRGSNARKLAAGGVGAAALASTRKPSGSSGQANNVFADQNGNVYRRQPDGSWQSRQNGQWVNSRVGSATPSATRAQPARPETRPAAPTVARQPARTTTASTTGSTSLNRDYQARQYGAQRTSVSKSRSSPSRPSRGGARRGGGGRR